MLSHNIKMVSQYISSAMTIIMRDHHIELCYYVILGLLSFVNSAKKDMWQPHLSDFEQNNWKTYKRISVKFSWTFDNETRNRWLNIGNVPDFGETLPFELLKIKADVMLYDLMCDTLSQHNWKTTSFKHCWTTCCYTD